MIVSFELLDVEVALLDLKIEAERKLWGIFLIFNIKQVYPPLFLLFEPICSQRTQWGGE